METLDYDHAVFGASQREADRNLAVRFYSMPIQDTDKSAAEGRPIFTDTPMIEIRVRGDRNNIVQRPVRQDDKSRFREAWKQHEDGKSHEQSGTPLSQWPIMSASAVEEMRYLGFYTVEQLAEAGEIILSKVPGLLTLKQKAQVFLDYSRGAAPLEQLQKKLEEEHGARVVADNNVAALAAKVDALQQLLEKQVAAQAALVQPKKG